MIIQRYARPNASPQNDYEKDLDKGLDKLTQQLFTMLNGGLSFSDNMNVQITSVTTHATPGTEVAVAHSLKRTPTAFIACGADKAGHIFKGSTAFSASNIYIRSDVASVTAYLIIF